MKKLIYILTAGLALGLVGCDDEAGPDGNYGEKTPVDFRLISVSPTSDPSQALPLTVDPTAKTDTTYIYTYEERDTVFDENGDPEIRPDGSLNITVRTIEYEGPIKARYYVYEPLVVSAKQDEYIVTLSANSRWKVGTMLGRNISCPKNNGSGDGYAQFKLANNRNKTKRLQSIAYIYSNDSTVMHKLIFEQKAQNE